MISTKLKTVVWICQPPPLQGAEVGVGKGNNPQIGVDNNIKNKYLNVKQKNKKIFY